MADEEILVNVDADNICGPGFIEDVPTSPLTVHATVATAQPDAAAFSGRDAKVQPEEKRKMSRTGSGERKRSYRQR